jgi:dihydroxyacetone kinase-like predicted kinase
MAEVFRSLGAAAIVPGGQTMNPSAQDILTAVDSVSAREVVILPNNRNIVLAARQATALAGGRQVVIVPTEDMAQGVSAMYSFNYELDAEANAEAMDEARAQTKTGEVCRAGRAARLDGRAVAAGEAIGLIGGALAVAAPDLTAALLETVARLGVPDGSTVTLYWGGEMDGPGAARARAAVLERYPNAEVEAVFGGQPHYAFLVAVE